MVFNNLSPFLKLRILNHPFPKDTKSLYFTHWNLNDKQELFTLAQDEEVGTNSGWKPHTTIEDSKNAIEKAYLNSYSYALRLKSNNNIVGHISLLPDQYSLLKIGKNEAEIGFWIGKDYWNNGYISEALTSILYYAFKKIHYKKIWGGCLDKNKVSEHLFIKNNFTYLKSIPIELIFKNKIRTEEKIFVLTKSKYDEIYR